MSLETMLGFDNMIMCLFYLTNIGFRFFCIINILTNEDACSGSASVDRVLDLESKG